MPKPNQIGSEKIAVRCRGAALADIGELVPIQGELKALTPESAAKLRASILKYGITFPLFVWRHKNKLNILDGTQRDRVLREMAAEGYAIPKLPIDYIEAANLKEAKEKILLISSQYGRMDQDSFERFIAEAEIDLAAMVGMVDISGIDFEAIAEEAAAAADDATETWELVIECGSKSQMTKLLARFAKEGLTCRALGSS